MFHRQGSPSDLDCVTVTSYGVLDLVRWPSILQNYSAIRRWQCATQEDPEYAKNQMVSGGFLEPCRASRGG